MAVLVVTRTFIPPLEPANATPPDAPSAILLHQGMESFPNPAADFANYPVRSGKWSATTTWMSGVPTADQNVVIDGHTVTLDQVGLEVATLLAVGGRIDADPTRDISLTYDSIILTGTAELHAHGATEADPFPANLTCQFLKRDTPLPDPADDPSQHTGGIIATQDSRVILRGAPKTSEKDDLRLAVEPLAGHTTLTLESAPSGWLVGDRLIIPPTDPHYSDPESNGRSEIKLDYRFEERTIAGIAGAVITLNAPLDRDHRGAHDPLGVLPPILPHILNVTRNVVIESANPGGTRGHFLVNDWCEARLHHVEIAHFGRTRGYTLNSSTFDGSGNLTHYGTNQIGRYSLHFHHCFGPENLANTGHQGDVVGCAIWSHAPVAVEGQVDDSSASGRKWPITIHGSSYINVVGNNVFGGEHSLIAFEDGNEAYCTIDQNALFGVYAEDISSNWPVSNGIWMTQPGFHRITNNVVAGGRNSLYLPHGWHTDGMQRGGSPGNINGDGTTQNFPLFRGANTMTAMDMDGMTMGGVEGVDYERVTIYHTQYEATHGNEFYALAKGPSLDHFSGTPGTILHYEDTTVWNCMLESFFIYGGTQEVEVDGFRAWQIIESGFGLNDQAQKVTLRNADIRCAWSLSGRPGPVGISHMGGISYNQQFLAEDVFVLAPVPIDLIWPTRAGDALSVLGNSRHDTFVAVTTANPPGQAEPVAYRLNTAFANEETDIPGRPYTIVVHDHQGTDGDDFRIFSEKQAADAIFPYEGDIPDRPFYVKYAGLVSGQTNAESWAASGRAYGEAIAPDDAVAVDGFPGAIVSPLPPPVVTSATINPAGNQLTLGISEAVAGHTGYVLVGSGSATPIGLTYGSGEGTASFVFNLARVVNSTETLTLGYTPGDVAYRVYGAMRAASGIEVTNTSTQVPDVTPPTLTSATLGPDGATWTLLHSEAVHGHVGYSATGTGGAVTLTYQSGENTATLVYTGSRQVLASETLTVAYTPGDVRDLNADNALATIATQAVTNNAGDTLLYRLEAAWPFDETTDNAIRVDATGHGHNLTPATGTVTAVTGEQAMACAGGDSALLLATPGDLLLPTSSWTLSGRLKLSSGANALVGGFVNGNDNLSWLVQIGTSHIHFVIGGATGARNSGLLADITWFDVGNSVGNFADYVWVGFWRDKASGRVSMRVNAGAGGITYPYSDFFPIPVDQAFYASTQPFAFGGLMNVGGGSGTASYKDWCFHSRTLTVDEMDREAGGAAYPFA